MGRRKIQIKAITDDRNRSVTFLKRKAGLFKKAHELSVLCSVDVAVLIVGNNKKLYEFSSTDINQTLQRYQHLCSQFAGPHEHKGPQDFLGKVNDNTDLGYDEDEASDPGTSTPTYPVPRSLTSPPKDSGSHTTGAENSLGMTPQPCQLQFNPQAQHPITSINNISDTVVTSRNGRLLHSHVTGKSFTPIINHSSQTNLPAQATAGSSTPSSNQLYNPSLTSVNDTLVDHTTAKSHSLLTAAVEAVSSSTYPYVPGSLETAPSTTSNTIRYNTYKHDVLTSRVYEESKEQRSNIIHECYNSEILSSDNALASRTNCVGENGKNNVIQTNEIQTEMGVIHRRISSRSSNNDEMVGIEENDLRMNSLKCTGDTVTAAACLGTIANEEFVTDGGSSQLVSLLRESVEQESDKKVQEGVSVLRNAWKEREEQVLDGFQTSNEVFKIEAGEVTSEKATERNLTLESGGNRSEGYYNEIRDIKDNCMEEANIRKESLSISRVVEDSKMVDDNLLNKSGLLNNINRGLVEKRPRLKVHIPGEDCMANKGNKSTSDDNKDEGKSKNGKNEEKFSEGTSGEGRSNRFKEEGKESATGKYSDMTSSLISGEEGGEVRDSKDQLIGPVSGGGSVSGGSGESAGKFIERLVSGYKCRSSMAAVFGGKNSMEIDSPISALPSRMLSDQLLPSPSMFYPEWGFEKEPNMLASPLTFPTPVATKRLTFREDELSNETKKRKISNNASGE